MSRYVQHVVFKTNKTEFKVQRLMRIKATTTQLYRHLRSRLKDGGGNSLFN